MRRYPSIRQWTLFGVLLIAVGLLGRSIQAQDDHGARETFQIMQLNETMGSVDPATGAVGLNRTRNELWARVHVTDLDPGSAFSIWAAIFNRPEGCTTNPAGPVRCSTTDAAAVPNHAEASAFNVGGIVTGVDGTANVNIHIRSGAAPEGAFILFGRGGLMDNGVAPGLRPGNGFGAEVHVVIRSHQGILPGQITAQLSEFNGGCPPNSCNNVQVATFPSVTDR
jgi:hypothetical protein